MEDPRFEHIKNDPKFRRIPNKEQKIKIDKRFQSMFKDKKFKVKYTVDKRGRPVNHTSTEDLKRYYEISSESESESENNSTTGKYVKAPVEETESNDLKVKHKSDRSLPEDIKKKLKNLDIDYARGEGILCSESSSDDEESEAELSEEEQIDHKWGELDLDAERTEEPTSRLAACNMDWDRIRAIDLMVLFNSFLPSGGVIKSVTIYSSEFGKERMKEEELNGPKELVQSNPEDHQDENEEGSNYHMEKLRQYQLNRLKYYYAIISFDSVNTANKVYSECDGMEYESSAIKLDLRFVPNGMSFDDEPKEVCDKLPDKYQPRFFTTSALQQAKVNLTWDETNPDRLEITDKLKSGKIEDISKNELQNYLASSSSEEDNEENAEKSDDEDKDVVDKYKALLKDIEEKEQVKKDSIDMEISWGIDLKEKTDKIMKEKLNKEGKTPFQQYLEKRKEKKKLKREQHKQEKSNTDDDLDFPSDIDMNSPYFAEEFNKPEFKSKGKKCQPTEEEYEQTNAELELLLMNEVDKEHFSLKKIQDKEMDSKKKRKNKSKEDEKYKDNFEIDVKDARFSALFTSHHFNIDPTDPHYKKTKAMETLIDEKLKRRNENNGLSEVANKKTKMENKKNTELNMLVKSVKRKASSFNKR